MTTTVTVEAHCNDKTEVSIIEESEHSGQGCVIQDGESKTIHVYDDMKVTVKEVAKDK